MSLSDFFNNLISDWTVVVKGFAALAAIIFVVVTAIVTKLAWARIVVSVVVAGFVIWAVTMDGLGFFATAVDQETALPAPTSPVLTATFDVASETWVVAGEVALTA